MNFIKGLFGSSTAAAIARGGYTAVSKSSLQPKFAPVAFGGSVVAGVVSMIIGGYKVADCLRYQESQGQCDETIEKNLPAMVAGVSVLFAGWGAFNTYNPKLHQGEQEVVVTPSVTLPPKELVIKDSPVSAPLPFEQRDAEEDRYAAVIELNQRGLSQRQISEELDISRYAVKRIIDKARRNASRGR
jgi:hypothetical protein